MISNVIRKERRMCFEIGFLSSESITWLVGGGLCVCVTDRGVSVVFFFLELTSRYLSWLRDTIRGKGEKKRKTRQQEYFSSAKPKHPALNIKSSCKSPVKKILFEFRNAYFKKHLIEGNALIEGKEKNFLWSLLFSLYSLSSNLNFMNYFFNNCPLNHM